MIIVQLVVLVAVFCGVMVGVGALTSLYPTVVTGWVVQALWGAGLLFSGWIAISIK